LIVGITEFKNSDKLFIPRGIAGIYAIYNIANSKRYIGSALSLHDRLYNHIWHLERGSHRNRKLLAAWRKHGAQSFALEVLEIVSDPFMLVEREQHWMDHHDSHCNGYNLNPRAESNLGRTFDSEMRRNVATGARASMSDPAVKERHRQATREAMSRPEVREKCRQAMLRRNADPDAKARLQAAQWTDEAREKRARHWVPKKPKQPPAWGQRYQIIWPDGKTEEIINLKAFCQKHGLPYPSAMNVLKGRVKTVRGVVIRKGGVPLS
jgi:group I intron endonuclease